MLTLAMLFAGLAAADPAIWVSPVATGAASSEAGRRVIALAKSALNRPPDAVAQLHTEGTLPGRGIREASIVAKRDQPITLALALAWRLTGDRAYLAQATRYLLAWVDAYQLSLNPIDETGFDDFIMANDAVDGGLDGDARSKMQRFWLRMATGYLDALEGGSSHGGAGNWDSHRVKLATLAAYRVGDAKLIARARSAFRHQLAGNLRADGTTVDFETRDALHYVTYDLDPLLMAALAAKAHGEDWFAYAAPSGACLARALDWLWAFASGKETHLEFVHSRVAFDRERAAAGQKEYAAHPWSPMTAVDTYALAACLDSRFAERSQALIHRTGRHPSYWIALTP